MFKNDEELMAILGIDEDSPNEKVIVDCESERVDVDDIIPDAYDEVPRMIEEPHGFIEKVTIRKEALINLYKKEIMSSCKNGYDIIAIVPLDKDEEIAFIVIFKHGRLYGVANAHPSVHGTVNVQTINWFELGDESIELGFAEMTEDLGMGIHEIIENGRFRV